VVGKKWHKVYGIIILQPYVTNGFEQNVLKEILYMTKVSVWIQQLNILCFAAGKWTIQKQYYPWHHVPWKRATIIFRIAPWNIGQF